MNGRFKDTRQQQLISDVSDKTLLLRSYEEMFEQPKTSAFDSEDVNQRRGNSEIFTLGPARRRADCQDVSASSVFGSV